MVQKYNELGLPLICAYETLLYRGNIRPHKCRMCRPVASSDDLVYYSSTVSLPSLFTVANGFLNQMAEMTATATQHTVMKMKDAR